MPLSRDPEKRAVLNVSVILCYIFLYFSGAYNRFLQEKTSDGDVGTKVVTDILIGSCLIYKLITGQILH